MPITGLSTKERPPYVIFIKGTPTAFANLKEKDANSLYYISELGAKEGVLQLGDKLIAGGGGGESRQEIFCATTATWNAQPQFVALEGLIYVYTDHKIYNGKYIPGIKIGDGKAYLRDLPFIDVIYDEHINNTNIHVSKEEKEFWNNKVRSIVNNEELVFTTK